MSLYRKLTPAEVLAMVAGAKGVTKKPGGDSVTQPVGTTRPEALGTGAEDAVTRQEASGLVLDVAAPAGEKPAPSPSMQRRSKDRHKPTQAEYMRAYRARKKAAA